jgi:hypothetical protein
MCGIEILVIEKVVEVTFEILIHALLVKGFETIQAHQFSLFDSETVNLP